MFDLRLLQHVVTVAEHGSFRRAAVALRLSQPALTKSVQQAERHYGEPLFDRHSRPVQPTPFGRVVIARARRVLSQAASLAAASTGVLDCRAERLSVGAGSLLSETLLPRALGRLIALHPMISLHVQVANRLELHQALAEGAIDLYVAAAEPAELTAEVEVIDLVPHRAVWFCRPNHPLARRRSVCRADLIEFSILVPTVPNWSREWFAGAEQEAGRPAVVHTVSDNSLIKKILSESDCLSVAPAPLLAADLNRRTFRALPVEGPQMEIQARIVHRRDRVLSPAAQDLVQLLQTVQPPTQIPDRKT